MKFGVKLARLDNRVRRRIDVCTISTSFEYRDVAGYLHVPVFFFFVFFFIDIYSGSDYIRKHWGICLFAQYTEDLRACKAVDLTAGEGKPKEQHKGCVHGRVYAVCHKSLELKRKHMHVWTVLLQGQFISVCVCVCFSPR